ncbi:unnamed protein product [Adineta steineri]|uniref:Cysteine dioxygenase n=1 Tax=Adineta steineri TaxID=433720 RepID=A0A819P2Z2_9BILA|nr:unnamed protein product [Adineta steineri]
MANWALSPTLRRRNPPPPPPNEEPFSPIIGNTIYIWLDSHETDYERFRKRFYEETHVNPKQWLFFSAENACYEFIKNDVTYPKKVILVTSGSLGKTLIEKLHHCEQLDAVYIYCQKVEIYREFAQHYIKVLGVYSNPVEIFARLKDYLDKKGEDTPSSTSSQFFPDNDNTERLSQSYLLWSPWKTNCCTKTLPRKGQATIVVKQTSDIPFQLILSNASALNAIHKENTYSIVLIVNKREVTLNVYINGQEHLLGHTDELQHILQLYNNDDKENMYWLSFSKQTSTVMYGIGEIRPKFKILEAHLDEKYFQAISNIAYLHIKINDIYEDFQEISRLEDKIQFLINTSPLLEPNLLVISESQSTLFQNFRFYSYLYPLALTEPCRLLYHNLIHFKLDDDDFPDLIPAIECSIKNPQGWCHQKLIEKANQFGRPNIDITYLRFTLDPFIIEIWPPGHYSPVHNHKNAYGMFRVLHGSILIRLFQALTLNLQYEAPIEYLLKQDQVTWMSPELNQTHQMKNIELSSCCIIVQCYEYDETQADKNRTEEYFDFIANNHRHIETMKPNFDMKFAVFTEKMKKEWNQRQSL